jgi:polysaccharide export outer membrane protein
MKKASRSWLQRSQAVLAALLSFVLILVPVSFVGATEYRVNIGDVLEVSAVSIPDFRHRSTVGGNGEVTFPLVGVIPASGKSVGDILKVIQERIPQKVLRRRGPDDGEHEVVIDGDEVSLSIAEYSPVYLKGDVSNPGSYPYRPGLTVRQAIALAGGYDTMRIRMDNPYLVAVDLRSERETLLNEYVRAQARIARVQAELGRDVPASNLEDNSAIAADIKNLEVEMLDTRKADFEKEEKHLADSIRSLGISLGLLEKQMQTEVERAKIDQQEMLLLEGLFAKGMIPITRLTDTRRLVLLSASRATEIEARTEQVRQQRADEERRHQKLFDERRIELLKELQNAKLEFAASESKLSAVTEKMFLVGGIRSQIGRGGTGSPDLVVFRTSATSGERIAATEETELQPRDVIEVSLRIDGRSNIKVTLPALGDERIGVGSLPSEIR